VPSLVAIDLDGTLLRSDKNLSKRATRAIQQCREAGVHVVLASARPPRTCRAIHTALSLDTYQINYNGALIHDATRDRVWHHQPLTAKQTRRIVAAAREHDPNVVLSLEVRDRWHTDRVDDALFTENAKTEQPHRLAPLDELITGPVTKCMLLAPPRQLAMVHQHVRRRFGRRIRILVSDHHLIQIVHRRVEKARALKRIARAYRIPAKRVMTIGDAPNDVGMLKWAGLGIAVENAWPRCREAADAMTTANDDDGVAEALHRYILNRI